MGSCCLTAVVLTSLSLSLPSPLLTSPHLSSPGTMSITPDLIEWLLADQKVCQCWRRLAGRMSLSCYVGYIESQEKSHSASLRLLLRLWSQAKPDSYNVKGLKRVLAAEGLHHMWLWISLMTQKESLQTISRKIQATNSRTLQQDLRGYKTSKIPSSPMRSYLYSPDSSSGYSSDSFSAGHPSCPTTPLNTRRKFEFDFSKTSSSQSETPRPSHRSNSSSRLSGSRDSTPLTRQPLRSSSLNRIPK